MICVNCSAWLPKIPGNALDDSSFEERASIGEVRSNEFTRRWSTLILSKYCAMNSPIGREIPSLQAIVIGRSHLQWQRVRVELLFSRRRDVNSSLPIRFLANSATMKQIFLRIFSSSSSCVIRVSSSFFNATCWSGEYFGQKVSNCVWNKRRRRTAENARSYSKNKDLQTCVNESWSYSPVYPRRYFAMSTWAESPFVRPEYLDRSPESITMNSLSIVTCGRCSPQQRCACHCRLANIPEV